MSVWLFLIKDLKIRKNELVQLLDAAWNTIAEDDANDLAQLSLFETWLLLRERARKSRLALRYPKNIAQLKKGRRRRRSDYVQMATRSLADMFLFIFSERAPAKSNIYDLLVKLSNSTNAGRFLESLVPEYLKTKRRTDPQKIFYSISSKGKAAIKRLSSKGIRGMSLRTSSQKVIISLHSNLSFEKVFSLKMLYETPHLVSRTEGIQVFDFGTVPDKFRTSDFASNMPHRSALVRSIDSLRLKPNLKRLV